MPAKKRRTWLKVLLICASVCAVIAAVGAVSVFGGWWGTFDADKLEMHNTTLVFDADGSLVAGLYGVENRVYTALGDIPLHVRDAFIAAEDVRFYRHPGVDVIRIGGALLSDIRTGSLREGASTITQQLIKNTHLTQDKTWSRKIKEAYLAIQLEKSYSKDKILEIYMNQVFLGSNAYGVQAAARVYFGKDIADITIAEGAALAAILKSPSGYAPHLNLERNAERRALILNTMEEEGMITPAQASAAQVEAVTVIPQDRSIACGWYVDEAMREAEDLLDITADEMIIGGYRIYTALDPALQLVMEGAAADPALFPETLSDGADCQCAMVAMDVHSGAVTALVGGREQTVRRAFNRATDMRRQPGSSLKPLAVYAPALERGYISPITLLDDSPKDFDGYRPDNFNSVFHGWVTARQALAQSYNVPAVELLSAVGVDAGREYLERFGLPVHANDAYLPLALGAMTEGATPVEMCAAYAALAAGGTRPEPYLIERIEDAQGSTLFERAPSHTASVQGSTAALITDMLKTAAESGTAKRLNALGFPVAAKTGTVAQGRVGNRDAWVAAYTPQTAVVAWMGYDQADDEHTLSNSVTGGTLPTELVRLALEEVGDQGAFVLPDTVSYVKLDRLGFERDYSVLLATDITPERYVMRELFALENRPSLYSPLWGTPRTPPDLTVSRGDEGYAAISFTIQDDLARYRLYRENGTGQPVEVTAFRGGEGDMVSYTDTTARRVMTYYYYIVPENALSVDEGIEAVGLATARLSYTVPLLTFETPLDWLAELLKPDEDAEDGSETPEPTETPALDKTEGGDSADGETEGNGGMLSDIFGF